MGIRDGRRENIPTVLQRREGECAELDRDHGVIGAKCRNQQPIERLADAAGVDECTRRQRYISGTNVDGIETGPFIECCVRLECLGQRFFFLRAGLCECTIWRVIMVFYLVIEHY